MKLSLPLLATSMLFLGGCLPTAMLAAGLAGGGGGFDDFEDYDYGEAQAVGQFDGTVWDVPVDGPADIQLYEGWGLDITGTTVDPDDGHTGMMMIYTDQSLEEVVNGGSGPFQGEILLCGDRGWTTYDEPAEEAEVVVEEDEDGDIVVLFRGERDNGARFQELSFVLDPVTLAPVDK